MLNTVYEVDPQREVWWQEWNEGMSKQNAVEAELSRQGFRPQPNGPRILPDGTIEEIDSGSQVRGSRKRRS